MPPLRVRALTAELRPACARLLAERHARHRERESLLPLCDDVEAQLPDAPGYVAVRGDEVVAYVAGSVADDERGRAPVATVGFAGVAGTDAEAVRDAYAALARDWVDAGCHRHAVAVPAGDALLADAFGRLAFGRQLTWAVREPVRCDAPRAGVDVRAGTPDDLDAIAVLELAFEQALRESPSFSGRAEPTLEALREEWRTLWDEPEFTHAVAEREGRVVGHLLLYDRPQGDLRVPPRSIDLAHAATLPEVRGAGVGLALTDWALDWAARRELAAVTLDWRDPNLLASRFWPNRGFRPQYHRLYRALP